MSALSSLRGWFSRFLLATCVGAGAPALLSGCSNPREKPESRLPRDPSAGATSASRPSEPLASTVLLRNSTSAYHSRLFPVGDELFVTTPAELFRVTPNGTVHRRKAALGSLVALSEDSVIFWRDGALRALPLADAPERSLVSLDREPRILLARGARLAFVFEEYGARTAVETLTAGARRRLLSTEGEVLAAALHEDVVYLLERTKNGWRLVRVPLDGGHVAFGEERGTRPPPMLATGPEGVFFYDGLGRGVRRIDFDLGREESISESAICAPMAVTSRILCAQVGGLVEVSRTRRVPRPISRELGGPIADLALGDKRAFWIADDGPEKMTVRAVALPESN